MNKKHPFGFMWRSKDGLISLKEMESKHLFYTWLMIWNNFCDVEDRVWYKGKKIFNQQTHSVQYLEEAFAEMTKELEGRNDMGFKSSEAFYNICKKVNIFFEKIEWLEVC